MNIKLLKVKLENIKNYEGEVLDIDLITEKRVYSYEKEQLVVSNLFSSINKLNSISFVGKNATGKTTTLNIMSDILKVYVDNKSISDCKYISNHFEKELKLKSIILVDNKLYMIESSIMKDDLGNIYFGDEQLSIKEATDNITKNEIQNFEGFELLLSRSSLENQFLKKDDSIFSSILNSNEESMGDLVSDMGRFTNFNFLGYFSSKMPLSFVNFLDPSIEEFYITNSDVDPKKNSNLFFCLKFENQEEIHKMDVMEIEKYLSSGTIKGINILFNTLHILNRGGYLLIDEIENHLNKSIVINLINLFTSKVNKNGATLIFTTHYSEILDTIERSDSIYVLNKKDKIIINKFSKLADKKDRVDKKKSDLMLSGELDTSPSYFAYQRLKQDIMKSMER